MRGDDPPAFNHHALHVDALDPSVVPNLVERDDIAPPGPGESPAPIYMDE